MLTRHFLCALEQQQPRPLPLLLLGKCRFHALYLREGLGAASWRIVPLGSRCHPFQGQQDREAQPCWALSSTFPFYLCSLPSSFHFPSQEWVNKALVAYDGTTKPTLSTEKAWMAVFVHDTNINVHKWRPKPDGFDISLQLSRHLHNLKGRICHSATALVPALSVNLRQIQFKCKPRSPAPQGSPVIHTLAWYSLLTLLQSPADPQTSESTWQTKPPPQHRANRTWWQETRHCWY